jgi:hypothetical protein
MFEPGDKGITFRLSWTAWRWRWRALRRQLTKRNDSGGFTRVIKRVSVYVILRDQLHTHPSDKHAEEVTVA